MKYIRQLDGLLYKNIQLHLVSECFYLLDHMQFAQPGGLKIAFLFPCLFVRSHYLCNITSRYYAAIISLQLVVSVCVYVCT